MTLYSPTDEEISLVEDAYKTVRANMLYWRYRLDEIPLVAGLSEEEIKRRQDSYSAWVVHLAEMDWHEKRRYDGLERCWSCYNPISEYDENTPEFPLYPCAALRAKAHKLSVALRSYIPVGWTPNDNQ